ncbi:MRPL36 protein [Gonium pectorale]|uniref:MRPL36 protein n=1 Tax=Gonium pectorale TaxID=33097 RepID=A0A150GX38_GONPE|nr:MRPL36 protein [Gonium pectorale]|eukprot:KXZ54248.1 MRPL36 protein [Gonium pectorale]
MKVRGKHKQRTKFVNLSTQAETPCCAEHSAFTGAHPAEVFGVPCLPETAFAAVQQHMLSSPSRY